MKKIFYTWLLLMASLVNAAEYRMVVPFAPGSQGDIAAREIAQTFERLTGNKMMVESIPGADGILGINHYKSNTNVDVIWLAASIVSYNPALKENLPYKDSDFEHIIFVGTAPNVWIASPSSKLKTATDLLHNMPQFVGGNASVGEMNVLCFKREKNFQITYVPFKGAPDVLVNTINGAVGAGVMNVSTSLIELSKSGKVILLGSSYKNEITIDGVNIPSVPKKTGVLQFNGFVSIAIRPNMETDKAEAIKRGLWLATQDQDTKEKLKKLYILPDSSNDTKWINQHFQDMRNQAKLYGGTK